MAQRTAHIVFAGGGFITPARTPYECELLNEHVLASVHHKQQMRIDIGRKSWLVKQADPNDPVACSACDRPVNAAVCHEFGSSAAFCVACALR